MVRVLDPENYKECERDNLAASFPMLVYVSVKGKDLVTIVKTKVVKSSTD